MVSNKHKIEILKSNISEIIHKNSHKLGCDLGRKVVIWNIGKKIDKTLGGYDEE